MVVANAVAMAADESGRGTLFCIRAQLRERRTGGVKATLWRRSEDAGRAKIVTGILVVGRRPGELVLVAADG